VARIWQARRIRPWKVETFKLSTDPSFESKLELGEACISILMRSFAHR
jgi:hypothetical protein